MEVYLAVDLKEKTVGAAYFKEETLYLLSKTMDDNYESTIDTLRLLVQPTHVFIPSNQKLVDIFSATNDLIAPCNLDIRPKVEFKYELAKMWLSKLDTDIMKMDSVIQFEENRISTGCAGAILHSITLLRNLNVRLFDLDEYMHLNSDSKSALRIFDSIHHPNMHSSVVKEGNSLFKILDKTRTCMGRKLLTSWFNFPLRDCNKIKERQDTVEFFCSPANASTLEVYKSLLSKLPNVPATWNKVKTKSRVSDWKNLLNSITCYLKIYMVTDFVPESIGFNNIKKDDLQLLRSASQLIEHTVDFEEYSDRLAIKSSIDPELDEMKRTYHSLDSFLSNKAETIQLPDLVAICFTLVYLPQMGFLICITFENQVLENIPGLEYKFSNENNGYYKDPTMLNLDEEIGDIFNLIGDKEFEILQSVRDDICNIEPVIVKMTFCIAKLDCYLSLAEAALKFNYVKPEVTTKDCLVLTDSRHPIQEHFVEFVVNDVQLGSVDTDLVKPKGILITGPNASGKSLYIQQIALITFMAHIGSFVPCSYARIGLTDKILTRIKTSSSVIKNESSFLVDLKQACFALSEATERSLVVIDEFGKGTMASDGVGLFCAIIKEFIAKGAKLLATTHFHEIIEFNFLQESAKLAFYTPKIIQESSNLVFLYDIVPGNYSSSLGILCAERVGLPADVVHRAANIAQALIKCEPIPLVVVNRDLEAEKIYKLFMSLHIETCDLELNLWRFVRQSFHKYK
ncbi:MutS protein msh5 [Boothiomyces macroporosus]|uniref:MutS protein msh5 n=1 Tax=Boothiomyces macroporosus TaxID=261099 RepID=A0AAD5Y9A7_9FUNG|nr:MutS protein msh5 [Boothiomyces macroporosus]